MKKLYILLFAGVIALQAHSQSLIALQHNGNATFYNGSNPIQDALTAAVDGDTMYIPGGAFNIGELNIDKGIQIIGAGHYSDSSRATDRTYITGNIRIMEGADSGSIQGIYLTGALTFGNPSNLKQLIHSYKISRNNLEYIALSNNGSDTVNSTDIIIEENIIRSNLYGANCNLVNVSKNIINGSIQYFKNSLFTNNIQTKGLCNDLVFYNVNNCEFQNNIFITHWYSCSGNAWFKGTSESNHFSNNIFVSDPGFPNGTNTGTGNWIDIDQTTIFVSQSGLGFNYAHNYHLQSPTTYIGNDGNEVGIYGTDEPYKEGAIPVNPHFKNINIGQKTSLDAKLPVNISIDAQNR